MSQDGKDVEGALVTVEGIYKVFGRGRNRMDALVNVSMRVPRRHFVSIVGPSGCGKSTLLKIIAGLASATSGEVRVNGAPVTGPSLNVGLMFQRPVLLDWRSVLDNVLLPIDVSGGKRGERVAGAARGRELLDTVGLHGFENHRPGQLSGGMQQRVALCRALIREPAVLLLDEPFGAVDQLTREQLNDVLLTSCADQDTTTVFVTHDIEEAVYLSDEVIVMSRRPGTIVGHVDVDLPRPRDYHIRSAMNFGTLCGRVREYLHQGGIGSTVESVAGK